MTRLIGFALACFLTLLAHAAAAEPTNCSAFYAGGEAPKVIEKTLAEGLVEICHNAYGAKHSAVTRTPLWAAERLTTASVRAAEVLGRIGDFHEEQGLAPNARATLSDYRCSGFDRGHMVPAGNTGAAEDSKQTFSLANMVPQDPYLNQGLWAALEEAVRAKAKASGEAFVVTGPLYFSPSLIRLKGRVAVPTHIFKAVYIPGAGASAYVARNWDVGAKYLVLSIAELRELSGIDVFPALPESVKGVRIGLPAPESSNFGAPFVEQCHRAPRTEMGRPNP